jgi:hypothetical protein
LVRLARCERAEAARCERLVGRADGAGRAAREADLAVRAVLRADGRAEGRGRPAERGADALLPSPPTLPICMPDFDVRACGWAPRRRRGLLPLLCGLNWLLMVAILSFRHPVADPLIPIATIKPEHARFHLRFRCLIGMRVRRHCTGSAQSRNHMERSYRCTRKRSNL